MVTSWGFDSPPRYIKSGDCNTPQTHHIVTSFVGIFVNLRQPLMAVLHERQLTLSRKKSRMGSIEDSFHFLGIHYSPTQREHNITTTHANDGFIDQQTGNSLTMRGG